MIDVKTVADLLKKIRESEEYYEIEYEHAKAMEESHAHGKFIALYDLQETEAFKKLEQLVRNENND